MALQVDPILQKHPWEKFLNISSDRPYINTALYRVLDESLKKSGQEGLLPLLICNFHTVHNGFHKGIQVFGQDCE